MTVLLAAVPEEASEAAAGLLHHLGASGVEVREAGILPPPGVAALAAGLAEVRGYFDLEATAEEAAERLLQQLEVTAQLEELPIEDWAVGWRRSFKPVRRGRVEVLAPWMPQVDSPRHAGMARVVLEPGMAFGTGDHPTTGLCLEAVDVWLQSHPDSSVLDVGTGSGILAIAARQLGAGVVVATDNDPIALRVARENAIANRVTIELRPDLPAGAVFQLVVANILANPLVELAGQLVSAMAPAGRLVLSGILDEQVGEVLAAYRPRLALCARTDESGWACLELSAGGIH